MRREITIHRDNDEDLTRLEITHLKNCYNDVLHNSQELYESKFFNNENDNFSYYLVTNKTDQSNRLLFRPVNIQVHELGYTPATDLISLLMFIRDKQLVEENQVLQIIIPIGEKNMSFLRHDHMVTLVIDVLGLSNSNRRYKINAKIIDSLSFSIPFFHQTESIHNILKIFFFIIKFEREYISHQSVLDFESCCYFTLKMIDLVLANTIQIYRDQKINSLIPKPNIYLGTCTNWLTDLDRSNIKLSIMTAIRKTRLTSREVDAINASIIEVE